MLLFTDVLREYATVQCEFIAQHLKKFPRIKLKNPDRLTLLHTTWDIVSSKLLRSFFTNFYLCFLRAISDFVNAFTSRRIVSLNIISTPIFSHDINISLILLKFFFYSY